MKKIITFLGIYFIVILNIFSQSYISFSKDAGEIDTREVLPKRDIQQYTNATNVLYGIPGAMVQSLTQEATNYSLLKVKGFGLRNEEGYPALPSYNDIIAVASTSGLGVDILSTEYIDIDNFTIYPAQGPELETDTVRPFRINRQAYQTNNFYPNSVVEIKTVQDYKGVPLAFVRVNPVQYNPVTKKIRCYSKIEYRLRYNNSNSYLVVSPVDVKMLSNTITNRDFLSRLTVINSFSKNYLIVTTNKFLPAVERFAAWKRQTGYKTKILVKDSWTSAEVKQSVHNEYNLSVIKPNYLLIVGDQGDVPGELIKEIRYHYSDLYYVCMGGADDYVPDMAKGRIPVSTLDEANVVFDKIINYQKNAPASSSFYQRGTTCAYFQAQSDRKTAQRRFTKTCEEVRDYLIDQRYAIDRVYYTESYVNPQFYNNSTYAQGEPLPTELLRPGFAWNGGSQDISKSINEGRFFILHRDHGAPEFWDQPRFTIPDINQLRNGDRLPVVFSMNCSTGDFSMPVCFCEAFLRHPSGGAVGIFGATQSSYSGNNDALTIGMFDAMWSNPGLFVKFGSQGIQNPNLNPHEDIYSMGDVLNQGLLRMCQTWNDVGWNGERYTHELFHYFGDPSMEIYTQKPSTFSNVKVTQNGNTVTVNTGGVSNCKIVLCSKADNGESYFSVADKTSSHTFTNVNVPCYICVTKHNYIPYFFNEDVYIQNKTLTGKNAFTGKNIKIGKNVTSSVTQGDVKISTDAEVIINADNNVLLDAGFKCEKGGVLKIEK